MTRDSGDFMRMQAEVEGMQDAPGARHAPKCLQMTGVIPHQRGDAVAGMHSKFGERTGKPAGAEVEFAIIGAHDGFVRLAGEDLDVRKYLPGALQERREGKRKIHHGAAHKPSRAGAKLGAWYHQSATKREGAAASRTANRRVLAENFHCKRG